MNNRHLSEFDSDPRIIEHYSLLEKLGIWHKIDELNQKLTSMQELISEVANLFTKTDIEEIVNILTGKVLDKFIPRFLVFVLKENVHSNGTEIICFENMKPVAPFFSIDSLEPFDRYFRSHPGVTPYAQFADCVKHSGIAGSMHRLQPALVVPIKGLEEIYGFILIGQKIVQQAYSEREIEYIDQLIRFASLSFQNNIHYTSAIKDNKTGAYNYAYFINRLNEELARIRRYQRQAVLVMLDIDHFKQLNDTYGHLAGDMVLKVITRTLLDSLRDADIVGRFGGEEFIILLVEASYKDGWNVAERLRKRIEALHLEYEKQLLKVNVSLGLRYFDHTVTESAEVLIRQADTALYLSKKNGRNQSSYFKEE